jgi:hypothetical protein
MGAMFQWWKRLPVDVFPMACDAPCRPAAPVAEIGLSCGGRSPHRRTSPTGFAVNPEPAIPFPFTVKPQWVGFRQKTILNRLWNT